MKTKMPTRDAKDDLKSLHPLKVERDQPRQTGVNHAGDREDIHDANDRK